MEAGRRLDWAAKRRAPRLSLKDARVHSQQGAGVRNAAFIFIKEFFPKPEAGGVINRITALKPWGHTRCAHVFARG